MNGNLPKNFNLTDIIGHRTNILQQPFSIFSLGDSAITIDLGNLIEEQLNRKALAIKSWLEGQALAGVRDIIVAYSTVSVFYDPDSMLVALPASHSDGGIYNHMCQKLKDAWTFSGEGGPEPSSGAIIRIPVCYGQEYGPDLEALAQARGLTCEEVVRLHSAVTYRVYMIGFLPGFSYLGKVDARLASNRKQVPAPVPAGGVGIAGDQTGIYPLNSPGGWQIIGRTPLKLFDPGVSPPVRLSIGDQVLFFPVSKDEFLARASHAAIVPASMPFKIINDQHHI